MLEYLESQRAGGNETHGDASTADRNAGDMEEDADEEAGGSASAQHKAGLLQTFVFSATLTLPQELRKRLRRGVPLYLVSSPRCVHHLQRGHTPPVRHSLSNWTERL